MININDQKTEISCPTCSKNIKVSMQQIAMQATVSCPSGHQIRLVDHDGSNKREIEKVNRELKKLSDALKRFGN